MLRRYRGPRRKVNHYDSDSDSPAWIAEDASLPDEITRYVDGLDGNLAVETGKTGVRVLQLVDLHGDVMTTLPIRDGEGTADWTALAHQTADEFGNPTDLTTGAAVASDGQSPGAEGRYGWLGGKQRSADALAGVVLMGVRLYDPGTGRFWSRDPSPGGNSTAYDYCSADPVNCTDLDGHWGLFKNLVKKAAKKVAAVAEVVATVVPGPIGVAAGAISAGAYAVSGNRSAALRMSVQAVAAMVPGGGAMVKAGFAAARAGGRVAAKAGGGNRSSLASAMSGTSACADPGSPGGAVASATVYAYDTADRLVSESAVAAGAWVYDPLGRITTAPVRGSPGATVQNAYYANDLIASQEIAGVARQSWSLDAFGRFASYTNSAWAAGPMGCRRGRRRSPRSTTTTRIRIRRRGSLRMRRCRMRSLATSTAWTATWLWRPARPAPGCCSWCCTAT